MKERIKGALCERFFCLSCIIERYVHTVSGGDMPTGLQGAI
jgi:hypothetical protein